MALQKGFPGGKPPFDVASGKEQTVNRSPHFLEYAAGGLKIYWRKRGARSAAALAYSLTLSLFPLLICLSGLLGLVHLEFGATGNLLQGLLPEGVLATLRDFMLYVDKNSTLPLFVGGLALLVTTSAMAYRTLSAAMADIQGESRFSGLAGGLFSFLFSLIFLAVIYVSVIIILTGQWFIRLLSDHFDLGVALFDWQWLRFFLLFLILFLIFALLYRLTVPKERPPRHVLTGACVAAAAMVVVSIAFSACIGLSTRYPLVYGSLASVVILMLWFYVFGTVLIGGSIINLMIYRAEQGIDPLSDPRPRPPGRRSFREQIFGQPPAERHHPETREEKDP